MRILLWSVGRFATAALTMFGVAILIFATVRLLPGNYVDLVLGPLATGDQRDEVSAQFGLDQPVIAQFFHWVAAALHGDFGSSFVTGEPVTNELALRLPVTIVLSLVALFFTVAIGVPLGFFTATRSGAGRGGALGRIASALGISIPEFVLGGIVVFVFSSFSLGLRIGNFVPIDTSIGGNVLSLLLPGVVLSIFCIAATARNTREAVMNVLVDNHIGAAVSRGESPGFILRHHVLRNASIPVLTLTSTITASLLGGAVIVESIFDVPGVGSYLVEALDRRDYAVIQTGVLLATAVFIGISLLVDVISGFLDPRLSLGRGATS